MNSTNNLLLISTLALSFLHSLFVIRSFARAARTVFCSSFVRLLFVFCSSFVRLLFVFCSSFVRSLFVFSLSACRATTARVARTVFCSSFL
ncbi:hypothetical protein HMPREF1321_2167 [Capnocytophaga sp. oral taxon 412 str. F0487]|nr:hypothetical protein HMPREF1321_2167 [Capnocytophaga sp. oral taxon 412 str. F0487]